MKTRHQLFFILFSFACVISSSGQKAKTFTNPLLPSGADPWNIYKNGYYYYTHTIGDRLIIWKTKSIARLNKAKRKTIFIPPAGKPYSSGLWAPEIHYINKRWYVYFAADSGRNETHRLWVLENTSRNPMKGKWILKGRIADSSNKWAIDGSVFQHKDQLYLIWSGWEGDYNGRQDIYISKMINPWTMDGHRVNISSPTLDWERHGDLNDPNNPPHVAVNEGPQFLRHKDRVFIVYSASGCWTDYYSLGMLSTHADSNLLSTTAWKKHPEPVFKASKENSVFAPGHNSFFKSPDGTEDWILYHANSAPGQGCGRKRSPRAQPFSWKADGTPDFGIPVKEGTLLRVPSNKKAKKPI
ncbi:MAG TPA: glycoside hydrolase family 43 protein [Flavisolibacter sp.]|nr:glycoside hydrolase family 43 protein [Flavisolibacter sp.]